MSLTILLPTYNEAENINPLISAIQKHVPEAEILVVDDNSPDGTAKIIKKNKKITIVVRKNNRGLTNSIRDGIQQTKTDLVGWMDCDFSMPPYKLVELLQKLYEGYDIAVGSRFVKGGKDMRGLTVAVILSWAINRFASFILNRSFKDYTSGFAAARRLRNRLSTGGGELWPESA